MSLGSISYIVTSEGSLYKSGVKGFKLIGSTRNLRIIKVMDLGGFLILISEGKCFRFEEVFNGRVKLEVIDLPECMCKNEDDVEEMGNEIITRIVDASVSRDSDNNIVCDLIDNSGRLLSYNSSSSSINKVNNYVDTDSPPPKSSGNNNKINLKIISLPTGTSVKTVATGLNYTLISTSLGTTYSKGSTSHGKLGLGLSPQGTLEFQILETLARTKVSGVYANGETSMCLDESFKVWTWGAEKEGLLGYESKSDVWVPKVRMMYIYIYICNKCILIIIMISISVHLTTPPLQCLTTLSNNVPIKKIELGISSCFVISSTSNVYGWGVVPNGNGGKGGRSRNMGRGGSNGGSENSTPSGSPREKSFISILPVLIEYFVCEGIEIEDVFVNQFPLTEGGQCGMFLGPGSIVDSLEATKDISFNVIEPKKCFIDDVNEPWDAGEWNTFYVLGRNSKDEDVGDYVKGFRNGVRVNLGVEVEKVGEEKVCSGSLRYKNKKVGGNENNGNPVTVNTSYEGYGVWCVKVLCGSGGEKL